MNRLALAAIAAGALGLALGGLVIVDRLSSGADAPEPVEIASPRVGSRVSELRPIIEVAPVAGAENYLIEVAPEPTFFDRNTITYASSHAGLSTAPVEGILQKLRLEGINKKYERYADRRANENEWRVSYNLTAVLGAPYGYRVIPCRDWLKHFSETIVEGHEDPLRAITEFSSFGVLNEGSGSGYYSAYEILTRDMGVCGNTAELVSALAAAQGFQTKILSLKAPDQGHVVASAMSPKEGWRLLDGLYNIIVDGDERELIERVRSDAEFLNFDAFDDVDVPYRHFFGSTEYAYDSETTFAGIQYTGARQEGGTIRFEDLKFACGPEMLDSIAQMARTRIGNLMFVRATAYVGGAWRPWGYSYFVFTPEPREGTELQDNARDLWRQGLVISESFVGGSKVTYENGEVLGSPAEQGYPREYGLMPDGAAWLSRPWGAQEESKQIGYDFGGDARLLANGAFVSWVTPTSMPSEFRIQGSSDRVNWEDVGRFAVPETGWSMAGQTDYYIFEEAKSFRAWRIVFDRAHSPDIVALDGFLLTSAPAR